METKLVTLPNDLNSLIEVVNNAFSSTPDSCIAEWFSFDEMVLQINSKHGVCVKAVDENSQVLGMMYAQQENPINGPEGIEKWVIIMAAINQKNSGQGIGSDLLKYLEQVTKKNGCKKMFVFTNIDDSHVINFYKKNGYKDAGWIKDYQYGKGNSAVFLLKYL